MSLYLALDAGGTATRCAIADADQVLGRASTGTVKLMNVDEASATERLHGLLAEAARAAGVSLQDVTSTCMGLAGVSSGTVRGWAESALGAVLGGRVAILGDEEVAFEGAFRGGAGILVIAGTGSNVMGRCANGTRVSAGGWGPMLGDEGSGYWIGLEAIKAALRAQDRGVATCLLEEIQNHWKLANQGELIAFANGKSRPQFAELAVVVAGCADSGDALARGVLERAGVELAEQVSLAASKMHAAGCGSFAGVAGGADETLAVAFTGSVLAKIPRVRRSMEEALATTVPAAAVADAPADPLEGALWLARRA